MSQIMNATDVEANPSDDEGLASVFFKLADGTYFTLCRGEDDETAYLEYADQSQASYSNAFSYRIEDGRVDFDLHESIADALRLVSRFSIAWDVERTPSAVIQEALRRIHGG